MSLHSTRTTAIQTGPDVELTPRQLQVSQLLAEGLTDRQIARRLDVASSTASQLVDQLRRRLCARNRAHAVALAYQHGFLSVDPELHARWWPLDCPPAAAQAVAELDCSHRDDPGHDHEQCLEYIAAEHERTNPRD
ncbi:MAG TPA: helix-turn-helix transcriptional regulator [Actinoplanes sp.]